MAKYKVIFNGEEEDETFDSYDGARDFANYLVSCSDTGAELLELSNPGDYPYDPYDEPEYEIIELDD